MNPLVFLDGYKTLIAGWLLILTGFSQMIGVAPIELSTTVSGWELVLYGFGLIGIGSKVEKLIQKKKK